MPLLWNGLVWPARGAGGCPQFSRLPTSFSQHLAFDCSMLDTCVAARLSGSGHIKNLGLQSSPDPISPQAFLPLRISLYPRRCSGLFPQSTEHLCFTTEQGLCFSLFLCMINTWILVGVSLLRLPEPSTTDRNLNKRHAFSHHLGGCEVKFITSGARPGFPILSRIRDA